MAEQIGGVLPLVALELPGLAGGEDGDDARPVVWLEVVGGFDEDEAERAGGVDGVEHAVDVQDVEAGACGAGWGAVDAVDEEGFDVAEAEER